MIISLAKVCDLMLSTIYQRLREFSSIVFFLTPEPERTGSALSGDRCLVLARQYRPLGGKVNAVATRDRGRQGIGGARWRSGATGPRAAKVDQSFGGGACRMSRFVSAPIMQPRSV